MPYAAHRHEPRPSAATGSEVSETTSTQSVYNEYGLEGKLCPRSARGPSGRAWHAHPVYAARMVDLSHGGPDPALARSPRRARSGAVSRGARRSTLGPRATVEDWLRIPEEKRAELIHGHLVYHTFPGVKHGYAQGEVRGVLRPYNRRRSGGGSGGGASTSPGGWWLSQEVDMLVGGIGCRPDVVGWRRDRHRRAPEPNARGVVTIAPDFVCEVLSESTSRYDQGVKRDAYFDAGVPHYWLVNPDNQTLTILERTDRGYLILRVAGPGDRVRAPPFEGVEIAVEELFMDEEGELAGAAGTAEETQPTAGQAPPATAAQPPAQKRAPRRRKA